MCFFHRGIPFNLIRGALDAFSHGLVIVRHRLLPALHKKQRPQWHSFNGLTGSWLQCTSDRVVEAVRDVLQQTAVKTLHQLQRIEKKVASLAPHSDNEELIQLVHQHHEWVRSRTAELAGPETTAKLQKALASHPPTLNATIQDAFASNQGCFEVNDGGWRRLSDEEAAARMQTAFVTGQVPLTPGSVAPTTEDVALFCRLLGHALYRSRHRPDCVVMQLVGEHTEEARRKILAITGGYGEILDPSTHHMYSRISKSCQAGHHISLLCISATYSTISIPTSFGITCRYLRRHRSNVMMTSPKGGDPSMYRGNADGVHLGNNRCGVHASKMGRRCTTLPSMRWRY